MEIFGKILIVKLELRHHLGDLGVYERKLLNGSNEIGGKAIGRNLVFQVRVQWRNLGENMMMNLRVPLKVDNFLSN